MFRIEVELDSHSFNEFGDLKIGKRWDLYEEYGQPDEFPDEASAQASLDARRAADPKFYEGLNLRIAGQDDTGEMQSLLSRIDINSLAARPRSCSRRSTAAGCRTRRTAAKSPATWT